MDFGGRDQVPQRMVSVRCTCVYILGMLEQSVSTLGKWFTIILHLHGNTYV